MTVLILRCWEKSMVTDLRGLRRTRPGSRSPVRTRRHSRTVTMILRMIVGRRTIARARDGQSEAHLPKQTLFP